MRFKGTFALLILCVALGAYLYFYEIKGGEQREKAKEAEKQIWKLQAKDIQEIDLLAGGQQIVAERKNDNEWEIKFPRPLEADSDELNRLANSASNIQREEVVEEAAADTAKFGLNPPRITLSLKTKDHRQYKIDFGNNNPTGYSTYAALSGSKTVFLVSSSVANTFDKKLEDLRNHSILSFEPPQAQTLNIISAKGNISLVKDKNDQWWFDSLDQKVAADSPQIRGILNALSFGRVKEFLDGDPKDYVNLGFDRPLIEVSLTYGKDKAIKHLVIGTAKSRLRRKEAKKTESSGDKEKEASSPETFVAKDASRDDLFFVEKELVDKLLKTRNELREKALATFQRWDIDSILLTNPKGTYLFTKSSGEWFLGQAKKKAKWDAVNGILDAMEKPVKKFLDKPKALSVYGLDRPSIQVILKQGETVIVDCSLGGKANDGVYAMVKGDPSIKIADMESLEKLDKGESDLVAPPAETAALK